MKTMYFTWIMKHYNTINVNDVEFYISVYCYDYMGRAIFPGQSYYDGCNTCTCGHLGRVSNII